EGHRPPEAGGAARAPAACRGAAGGRTCPRGGRWDGRGLGGGAGLEGADVLLRDPELLVGGEVGEAGIAHVPRVRSASVTVTIPSGSSPSRSRTAAATRSRPSG